jgi:sulfatase modifying factor 1
MHDVIFARIPGGRFLMGSDRSQSPQAQDDESPIHEVEVDAFECAIYPVTEEDWAEFVEGSRPAPQGRLLPVTGVSWHDATAFCEWHSANGREMRLPTEAEWEYAARGGLEGARYPGGNEIPDWLPAAGRGPLDAPWPVTLGAPNGFGLYGIGANVHEWCADWHSAGYYAISPRRNPQGPATGVRRASRGGAWRHAITISRCAQRSKIDPSFRYSDYGFRVVRRPS